MRGKILKGQLLYDPKIKKTGRKTDVNLKINENHYNKPQPWPTMKNHQLQ